MAIEVRKRVSIDTDRVEIRSSHQERGLSPSALVEGALEILVAAFFLRSSLAHLANPYYFLSSVYKYELAGATFGQVMAMVTPFALLLVSLCLLARLLIGGALLIGAALAGGFTIAQTYAIYRGLDISCGCFGPTGSSSVSYNSLAIVCALFVSCLAALWLRRRRAIAAISTAGAYKGKAISLPYQEQ